MINWSTLYILRLKHFLAAVYLSTPVNHAYTPNKGGEEVSENEPDVFINNYLTGGFPSADESIPEVSDW